MVRNETRKESSSRQNLHLPWLFPRAGPAPASRRPEPQAANRRVYFASFLSDSSQGRVAIKSCRRYSVVLRSRLVHEGGQMRMPSTNHLSSPLVKLNELVCLLALGAGNKGFGHILRLIPRGPVHHFQKNTFIRSPHELYRWTIQRPCDDSP